MEYVISIHAPIVGCDLKWEWLIIWILLISIHAPIVGCDMMIHKPMTYAYDFNPRTHRGVRRKIHPKGYVCKVISIHAPIVGCDTNAQRLLLRAFYFNPRTHRGVRLNITSLSATCNKFQSTHPSWGATKEEWLIIWILFISIHAPIVGCDSFWAWDFLAVLYFNPRTHRGVRLILSKITIYLIIFQSTHPSWGAT